MRFRISVDVGGTFTDMLVLNEDTKEIFSFKTPTTPENLMEGVFNDLKLAAEEFDIELKTLLQNTLSIVHGTTASTNALIEGEIGKVGVITTKGFRDVLHFREGGKEEPFNWDLDFPRAFVPRYLILPVTERINSEGEIEEPLIESEVQEALNKFKEWNVDAISVCLLWSFINPEHEIKIGKIIEQNWPEIPFDLSHEINPIIREYRRFIATAINSSLRKIISKYISALEESLNKEGFKGNLFIATSGGGVLDPSEIIKKPILTVNSGPSMLPVAARNIAIEKKDSDEVIGIDMGGTSFDISFIRNGMIVLTEDSKINPNEVGGDKLGIPKVDVESVGSGGGSIAWIDSADYLHVGPQSAGAFPGPACYGLGGKKPTLTDANLLLGYLNPDYFLGGQMKIYPDKAKNVLREKISNKLNIDVVEASSRIYTTVNYDMLLALRDLAIKRGVDPRESLLVGGGGAFGIHCADIAKELNVNEILLPKEAGVLSSYGCLISNIKQDFRATAYSRTDSFNFEKINKTIEMLENRANMFLDKTQVPPENRQLKYYMEARYPYQIYNLDVPLENNRITEEYISKLSNDFHDTHYRYYASKDPNSVIETTAWRISAIGKTPKTRLRELDKEDKDGSSAIKSKRLAFFRSEENFVESLIYNGDKLNYGNKIIGPAIIEEKNTTIVIPPDYNVNVMKHGDYLLKLP